MNEGQDLRLQLTLAEINQLLAALGMAPYRDVYQLIAKIQSQAETQLEQADQTGAVTVKN
jgi:hypothetical protein